MFGLLVRSAQGRIYGGAKISKGGPFLQKTSYSHQKDTAIRNQMHSNDLEASVVIFGSILK